MPHLRRRAPLACAASLALLAALPSPSLAQGGWPTRPVTIIDRMSHV